MNIQSNSYQNSHPKCKGCKSFFGSEAFQGYCSSCYKKQFGIQKQQIEKEECIEIKISEPPIPQEKKQMQQEHKDLSRCTTCNRKIGLLGIQCKCGLVFCNKHKMPEDHTCLYDYFGEGTKYLQKNLIKVTKEKIQNAL